MRRALAANRPTRIVLNHCDYLDPHVRTGEFGAAALAFLESTVETAIGRRVDWVGIGPAKVIPRDEVGERVAARPRSAVEQAGAMS